MVGGWGHRDWRGGGGAVFLLLGKMQALGCAVPSDKPPPRAARGAALQDSYLEGVRTGAWTPPFSENRNGGNSLFAVTSPSLSFIPRYSQ